MPVLCIRIPKDPELLFWIRIKVRDREHFLRRKIIVQHHFQVAVFTFEWYASFELVNYFFWWNTVLWEVAQYNSLQHSMGWFNVSDDRLGEDRTKTRAELWLLSPDLCLCFVQWMTCGNARRTTWTCLCTWFLMCTPTSRRPPLVAIILLLKISGEKIWILNFLYCCS